METKKMYRYVDARTAGYKHIPVELVTFYVVKETEHYAWVCVGDYIVGPPMTTEIFNDLLRLKYIKKVKKDAVRSFCYFKKADALYSYRVRKIRQNKILTNQLETNEHIFKYLFGENKTSTEIVDEIDGKYKTKTLHDIYDQQ